MASIFPISSQLPPKYWKQVCFISHKKMKAKQSFMCNYNVSLTISRFSFQAVPLTSPRGIRNDIAEHQKDNHLLVIKINKWERSIFGGTIMIVKRIDDEPQSLFSFIWSPHEDHLKFEGGSGEGSREQFGVFFFSFSLFLFCIRSPNFFSIFGENIVSPLNWYTPFFSSNWPNV